MKLLSKSVAQNKIKKDNDELIDTTIRTRKAYAEAIKKLNGIKANYDPEKLKKFEEFKQFCKDLLRKKEKLLEEYSQLEAEIERKKDIYYGLIAKQDALDEKVYEMREQEKKLDLREKFVTDLEKKINNHE